ncbi:MAG TPA: aminotransferase class III-fold pyridoxal phosphate-dependent enzyme [Mycobacteriales bacterium]|nr:aminotransferase class III-fold pyridoxal phosphate-dependent enzyme [Mycobacteriales bacterium]
MSHVFARSPRPDLPVAVSGTGAEIVDAAGRRYLDGSGGAVVVGIGHGVTEVSDAIAEQSRRISYVHGTAFATEAVEAYADELAAVLPLDDARVYPVSGGSEAVETALKMARAYHLSRGEDRHLIVSRQGSYHGNTRGALDASGRRPLRAPYLPWLGQGRHTTTPYEYRCPFPDTHPVGCGARHAAELDRILAETPAAAFLAEPVAGAALGACVPPADYWPAVADVCRRHGVLLIADEVMTGFGRTGRWFACDHWDLRPDIVVGAKGASSGYWPLGFAASTAAVHETIKAGGFTHGFTNSHHPVGAAAGRAVLKILREQDLVAAAERQGDRLDAALRAELGDHDHVGDIRGIGLLRAVEFVADRSSKAPFPRAEKVTERVVAACADNGALVYSSTGGATGTDGDLILFGPPLVITDDQVDELALRCTKAIRSVLP